MSGLFGRPGIILPAIAALLTVHAGLFVESRVDALTEYMGAILIAAFCLALWCHALGHVLAGAVQGMRITHLCLWPWTFWLRSATAPPMSSWSLAETRPHPRELATARREMAIVVLAGPIVGLILAWLAAYMATMYVPESGTWLGPFLSGETMGGRALYIGLTAFSVTSAAFAIWSILPISSTDHPWDGYILSRLARGGEAARAMLAQFVLVGLEADGVRPKLWPPELVEAAQTDPSERLGRNGRLFRYWWLLDQDPEIAEEALAGFDLPDSYGAFRVDKSIYLERGFIRRWRLQVPPFEDKAPDGQIWTDDWRTNYRYHAMKRLCEGDAEGALRSLTIGRAYLDRTSSGISVMEAELYAVLIQRAAQLVASGKANLNEEPQDPDEDVSEG